VQVWKADGSGQLFIYKGHSTYVWSVAWSPDGTRIVSASQDGTVQIWNADTFFHKGEAAYVRSVAWSSDGIRIASASQDGTVQVWSAG